MKYYELTKDAENDLREVARYTLNKWGREKLHEYRSVAKRGCLDWGQTWRPNVAVLIGVA